MGWGKKISSHIPEKYGNCSLSCNSLVPALQIWDPRFPKSCTCRRWMVRAWCLSGTPQRTMRWWPTIPSCTERPMWRTISNRSSVPLNHLQFSQMFTMKNNLRLRFIHFYFYCNLQDPGSFRTFRFLDCLLSLLCKRKVIILFIITGACARLSANILDQQSKTQNPIWIPAGG